MTTNKHKNALWYPRFYKDYQIDTAHLSMIEHGAYTLMLDYVYLTGKPLPLDETAIARLMRCMNGAEIEAMESVLHQFFQKQVDGWHNKRADEELALRHALIEKKSAAGKNGAAVTWGKNEADANGDGICYGISHDKCHDISQNTSPAQVQVQTHIQKQPQKEPSPPTGVAVWESYSAAYETRYGALPVRNAKNNALCKQIVTRLGADEAPQVAAFFVFSDASFYVQKGHSLTLLVSDAEKLRTEWITGNRMTATAARQADRRQNTGDVFNKLIAEVCHAN